MTEVPEPNEEHEHDAIRDLVKRALEADTLVQDPPDILRGVQRRIRMRSRGKFFAERWSPQQARLGYLVVALVLVLLAALAYWALLRLDIR